MQLGPGTRLGPYEIVSALGAGGMGEVYRATDTSLGRQVAIKVLPEVFAQDADRLARFEREAKTLAALNHPHIAQIYGLEKASGVQALVMELVEGEDLSRRIARGPIPLDEALPIAKQIAEALEAAHEQGIIHRDLKPANVKVRDDGTVKVLDFGLAKLAEPTAAATGNATLSPTITSPALMTGVGVLLGTAAYMSPEQAKGRPADKRSDIWAFACVLFEMLTGRRAFEGEDVTDTIAAIVRGEPAWNTVPADVPDPIKLLLKRGLEKDRSVRLSDSGTVRFLLSNALTLSTATPATPSRTFHKLALPIAATALIVAGITSTAWWYTRPLPPSPKVTRFPLVLPAGQTFSNAGRQVIAISPDGTQIVYTANQRLWLRSMSEVEARPIAGIDGSSGVVNPVFSPDGRSIAYYSVGDMTLKRIAVTGGAAITLCPAENPFGLTWTRDEILFGQGLKGIMRVADSGGKPEVIVRVKTGEFAHGPQLLPDGETVLFTLVTGTDADRWDKGLIVVQSLKSGKQKTLINGGSDARYLSTGHLVYGLGGVMFAVPFDLRRLEVLGGPVSVVEGVRRGGFQTASAQFSTAANGSLVFIPGPVSTSTNLMQLALIDRKGTAEPLKLQPATYQHPRISPDGKRIVFATDDGKDAVVWIYDLSGTTAMRRLTFGGKNRFPIWSADGQRVAFQSDREGDLGLFWQAADGSSAAERLTKADKDTSHIPESWSPKADAFLFRVTKGPDMSLSVFSLKAKTATSFGPIRSQSPTDAVFSSDGRWVAYSAQRVLYVQPFPATGATYQLPVLEEGGYRHPRWSPDGKELFYFIGGNVRMRAVTVTTQPTFAFGNPTPIPNPPYWWDSSNDVARQYDVEADGQRFVGLILAGSTNSNDASASTNPEIRVVLNWFEELKARVPTK